MEEYTFYRIVCKNPEINDCYVGSTKNYINRINCHKGNCNNENSVKYNYKVYEFIRKNGGFENFDVIEIEKLQLETKIDALKRERYWMDFFKTTLNKVIPTQTYNEYIKYYYEKNAEKIKETKRNYYDKNKHKLEEQYKKYREENAEYIKEWKKKYYLENKDIINEQNKIRYEKNKDKYKERRKIYCENNKELISIKTKEYREKNKEELKEKKSIKIECICGSIHRQNDKAKHKRTLKHQRYLEEQQQNNKK